MKSAVAAAATAMHDGFPSMPVGVAAPSPLTAQHSDAQGLPELCFRIVAAHWEGALFCPACEVVALGAGKYDRTEQKELESWSWAGGVQQNCGSSSPVVDSSVSVRFDLIVSNLLFDTVAELVRHVAEMDRGNID
eukprot:SAG31_NODE_5541_length_2468_cov_1.682566_1_plen_135_part_00